MKKKICFLIGMIVTLLFSINVKASSNTINSIKMDISIDEYGNAHIEEVWDATLYNGTEGYKSYGINIGNAYITNFKVSDNGIAYTSTGRWNTSASFEDKAYRSGINETSNAIELCWGISEYGNHTYYLEYDIEGFVAQLDDSQMIYWELLGKELSSYTNSIYIKIYREGYKSEETGKNRFSDDLPVWGYGNKGGYAYVYDGYIEISNYNLKTDEYIVALVKFPQGTFNTSNVINNNFEYYYNMAQKGAEKYVDIWGIIKTVIAILFPIIVIITAIFINSKNEVQGLDFGEAGKKLPKDVNMFRDLPCGKDLNRAYWLAFVYDLMKNKNDFLGVILLKWLHNNIIKIENVKSGLVFKRDETVIVFPEASVTLETDLETSLYNYMYEASKDGKLESNEFEKWCGNHYKEIMKWFNDVLNYERDLLVKENKIVPYEKTTMKIFHSTAYKVDPSMKDEAIKMKGLKEFFNYFENMQDKEAIEVRLWEEYLMYAQLFGVADKVAKQFKKLYPDMITDYNYDSIVFIRTISYRGMSSAKTARDRANAYSAGGGGFSSGGGGGGSFGGGGGGGFR